MSHRPAQISHSANKRCMFACIGCNHPTETTAQTTTTHTRLQNERAQRGSECQIPCQLDRQTRSMFNANRRPSAATTHTHTHTRREEIQAHSESKALIVKTARQANINRKSCRLGAFLMDSDEECAYESVASAASLCRQSHH